jgi:magnesium transporter
MLTLCLGWFYLLGGFISLKSIGAFWRCHATTRKLVLFTPIYCGYGGNGGVQSSAITVQGLANNTLEWFLI